MKNKILKIFSILLMTICVFAFAGCNEAKTISKSEYENLMSQMDTIMTNYSFKLWGNTEKVFNSQPILDAQVVVEEDSTTVQMTLNQEDEKSLIFLYQNKVYVENQQEKFCFEFFDLAEPPASDINFSKKVEILSYLNQALVFSKKSEPLPEEYEINTTFTKIEETKRKNEILLKTCGETTIHFLLGNLESTTLQNFENEQKFSESKLIKVESITKIHSKQTMNGEEIANRTEYGKILAEINSTQIEIPSFEGFQEL